MCVLFCLQTNGGEEYTGDTEGGGGGTGGGHVSPRNHVLTLLQRRSVLHPSTSHSCTASH